MDQEVVDQLRASGFDVTCRVRIPHVPIAVSFDGRVLPIKEEVVLTTSSGAPLAVDLKPITELFAGDRTPPDFADGPPHDYVPFFATIELTAADYCSVLECVEVDREFERLYRHLRRRPDGSHRNPLFSYLQAAARLYMSLHDVSQAEFEAVVRRIERSARTFSMGSTSRNYHNFALRCFVGKR